MERLAAEPGQDAACGAADPDPAGEVDAGPAPPWQDEARTEPARHPGQGDPGADEPGAQGREGAVTPSREAAARPDR